MEFTPDTRLALDPDIRLKDDVDRAILINRPRPLSNRPDLCHYLHPKDAVLLALFDGERTVGEIRDLWTDLLDRPREKCDREVDYLLDRYACAEQESGRVLIGLDRVGERDLIRYDPKDFVTHRERVNLTDPRFRKPYIVYYLPTMFCPQRCVYCYAKTCPDPEQDLIPLPRLQEIFAELAEVGVEAISLSGGDPFARKGIFEILESLVEAGLAPDIPTKAGLGYRHMRQLRELGIDSLQVSLDSADPQIMDRMVGISGYHRKLFRLMEDLRRAGMEVRVNTVLTPINHPTLGALIDYLGGLGNVSHLNLSPYGRSMFCHSDELFIEPDDVARLREVVAKKRPRYPSMGINVGDVLPAPEDPRQKRRRWEQRAACTANRRGFIILPDGQVTVCEELYDHPSFIIGDLREQSVMEMWTSPQALALIQPEQAAVPDGPCRRCRNFTECHSGRGRCWRDVLKAYGWNRPHYPDPRCPAAPPALRLA